MKTSILVLALITLSFGCQPTPEPAEAEPAAAVVENAPPDPYNPKDGNLVVPTDWLVRLDQPDDAVVIGANADSSDIYFVNMSPGWHVTTGPAGIFYHPNSTATGNYKAQLDVYLFNPGERTEAFGLFFGGADLNGETQTYDYFLIRNSGEYLIKRRSGDETSTLAAWTTNPAIKRYTDPEESSVLNKLAVQAEDNEVVFLINDIEVTRLPRADVHTEGVVGMRVNHALNLHISDLKVASL
ncbi:MAG: hypothetical protein AAF564_23340 [Bacteroidota bacterium]